MEARLQKWGNSDGLRIPSSFLKTLNLKTNDLVNIDQVDDKIVITKSINNTISLEQKFMEYDGGDLDDDFEWDEPRGREIW